MLQNLNLSRVLFIDIETVPLQYEFNSLDENTKTLWEKKSKFFLQKEQLTIEESYSKAGIYAEFAKVICIGVGYILINKDGAKELRVTSLSNDNETELLSEFLILLSKLKNKIYLCAHNGKEFHFPFLPRRMMINGLKLPPLLNLSGEKPWENPHFDTMEMWRFGDYKHFTSLELLAHVFGIESPKQEIDGSKVAKVYYEEKNLPKIAKYCLGDVTTTAQVFLRLKGENVIQKEHIKIIN